MMEQSFWNFIGIHGCIVDDFLCLGSCLSNNLICLCISLLHNAADKAEFDEYIDFVKSNTSYDSGVTAEYGDELITLSTCASHTEDGRFVVVARRITGDDK